MSRFREGGSGESVGPYAELVNARVSIDIGSPSRAAGTGRKRTLAVKETQHRLSRSFRGMHKSLIDHLYTKPSRHFSRS